MRKLIGGLVIGAAIIFGVGLYLDWFSISSTSQPGEAEVGVSVDKEKIAEDLETAKDKAKELGEKFKEKVKQ